MMARFVGEIYQVPPVRSAVKREQRTRRVFELEPLEIDGRDVLFRVRCESGTYIRTLAVDLGDALGVGANLVDLRRTRTASFEEADAHPLNAFRDALAFAKEDGDERPVREVLRPIEDLLRHLPRIVIKDTAVDALCHGANLAVPGIAKLSPHIRRGDSVGVLTGKGEAVALSKALMTTDEIVIAKSGAAADTGRVLMEPGPTRNSGSDPWPWTHGGSIRSDRRKRIGFGECGSVFRSCEARPSSFWSSAWSWSGPRVCETPLRPFDGPHGPRRSCSSSCCSSSSSRSNSPSHTSADIGGRPPPGSRHNPSGDGRRTSPSQWASASVARLLWEASSFGSSRRRPRGGGSWPGSSGSWCPRSWASSRQCSWSRSSIGSGPSLMSPFVVVSKPSRRRQQSQSWACSSCARPRRLGGRTPRSWVSVPRGG